MSPSRVPLAAAALCLVSCGPGRGQRTNPVAAPARPSASAATAMPPGTTSGTAGAPSGSAPPAPPLARADEKPHDPVFELSSPVPLLPEGASSKDVSAALAAVRASGAGCAEFNRLGPRVMDALDPQGIKACGVGAKYVRCVEGRAGYYVPVFVQRNTCQWNLWFVPHERSSAPVHGAEDYSEFDIQYTADFVLDDFAGSGVEEALVTRGYEHPEGIASGTNVVRHLPDGRVLRTDFDAMTDVDGDGLLDGVMSFDIELSDICRLDQDEWAMTPRYGPTLIFHRLPDRRFSLNDQVALEKRAKACADSEGPVVVLKGGRISEDWTATRALCQVARGRPRAEVWAEIEHVCRAPRDLTKDCPRQRPYACGLPEYLPGWLERVSTALAAK